MATRRMLHRNISLCEQLADCSLLARLLYTWGLPHSSDWGVLAASPRRLKAEVMPISDDTPEQIGEATRELLACGLWNDFTEDGTYYVYYPTFEEYQDLRHRRETSRDGLPKPPTSDRHSREVTVTYGNSPEVAETHGESTLKGRESKGTESKRTEGESEHAPAEAVAAPSVDTPFGDADPADFSHMDSCNSSFTQAFVRYFRDSKPPQQAQAYAQDCRQQLAVPGAGITEEQVEKQVRAGNGPQAGKESGRFGAEAYLTRLLKETKQDDGPRGSGLWRLCSDGSREYERTMDAQQIASIKHAISLGHWDTDLGMATYDPRHPNRKKVS